MSTYTPISTQTLTADAATVTFTGIPQTYTDIVLVCNFGTSSSGRTGTMRFNGDTGTNYSWRSIGGNGTSAQAGGGSNISSIYFTGQITGDGTALANVAITSIQNYSNTTTYKTVISRSNDAARYVELAVGTWRSTAAINRIDLARDNGTNWLSGSSFTLYGIGSGSPKAFGGDEVTTDGTYWYHTFRSSGIFAPIQSLTCDYLVVAGGGGGGSDTGGGGGAGGLRSTVTATGGGGSLESALFLTGSTNYTVTIGAGGAGGATSGNPGVQGSNSVFATITSTGGGGGGGRNLDNATTGGSGGAGAGDNTTNTARPGKAGTANQGYAGGNGKSSTTLTISGGGGGGAGGVGATSANNNGGTGGVGVSSGISGSTVGYAGGGGGGEGSAGTGGTASDGGGAGASSGTANSQGFSGTANRGGGGGGGGRTAAPAAGGAGGSGIVIVRYAV